MQPGPPQPPMGQPGQPYPGPGYGPPGYPPQPGYQQPAYPQPGYPQPGYPQPGFAPQPGYPQQLGYPQQPVPGMPGPAGPRKSRTGLIVVIVVAVVVVLGGGATAFFLLDKPSQPAGRYTATQTPCSKLNAPPYKFTTSSPSAMADQSLQEINEDCTAKLGTEPTDGTADVTLQTYLGGGGPGVAQRDTIGDNQQVSGMGFENPVNVTYAAGPEPSCEFHYYRSNEYVQIRFTYLPGVHDRNGCLSVGLPFVTKLYAEIG